MNSKQETRKTSKTFRIFLIAALLAASTAALAPAPAHARDVPFPTEHTVDGDFDGARDVYAADVDGDGDLDILGAARVGDDITWWENGSTPTNWAEHTVDAAFDGAYDVAAADVDGDGDLDVLGAAEHADEIAWWENTVGDGSAWSKHSVGTSFDGARSVVAADVDGDGDLDVLGAAYYAYEIAWWENTVGDGSAWSKHTVDGSFSGAISVAAADVDGDGDLDVLGAAYHANDIAWWENTDGDGSVWIEHGVDVAFSGAHSVTAADVDGDGDLDVLGAAHAADEIAWWENGSTPTNWNKHTVDAAFDGAVSVAAADVDGDGDLDILGAAYDADEIAWWENTAGDGSVWSEHTVDATFYGAYSVTAADVDGDGDLDILGASSGDNDIAWWENETIHRSGTFPNPAGEHTVDATFDEAYSVAAADVDGDGDLDILGAALQANDIAWWENTAGDGSAWSEHGVDQNFDYASAVYAADVDGDGDLDVLGASYNGISGMNNISWWENTAGDGSTWSEHSVDATFDGAMSVAAADVDGDGDLDVLGAAKYADDIAWWENTAGDGSAWSEHGVDRSFDGAMSVAAADVDGDGDLDILGAAYDADDIAWWENTAGDGSAWSEHSVDATFDGAMSVAAADMDGDGDLDILGAAYVADDITWWENNSTGGGWSEHTVDGSFNGAISVAAADVDGDGDRDVLGAAKIADDIAWWENRGGQFALATTGTAPSQLASGQTDDLLKITMTHNGRSGDGDEELATLELLFEESASDPLTTAEANAVIENLHVYLDDGSGVFESGSDTLVTSVGTLALTAGVQTVTLPDGDANVQVQFGTPRTHFVVVELAADAHTQTAIDQIQVTHVTESSSTAQDRVHDIPLTLEYAADTASSAVAVPRTRTWDSGGATQDWSEAANWISDIAPRTFDGVRFDNTSLENAAIDASFSGSVVDLIIASNYTGQITQNAGLTLSGDFSQGGGTFTGGSSALEVGGAFDLSGGTFTAPSGLMTVSGGFHHTGGTFDPNGGHVVLGHTSDQTLVTDFHDLTLNDGLLGYWKLDEGTGTTAADSSGYGHGGTLNGGPTFTTTTPITITFHNPYALDFDGGDDYVAINGVAGKVSGEVSIALWLKAPSDRPVSQQAMVSVNTAAKGNVVVLGIGGDDIYRVLDGGSDAWEGSTATDVADGTWHHLAYTSDGSTGRLYVDGVEKATHTPNYSFSSDDLWSLGQEWDAGTSDHLDGTLDDVRIYNRALSGTYIQALADGKHPQTSVATTTLTAPLDVNGDLTLNGGTLDVSASNYRVNIAGDFTRNGGVFEPGEGIVTFDGAGDQNLDTDAIAFYDLTVNSGSTLVDLADFTVDGTLTNNGSLRQTNDVPNGSTTQFLRILNQAGGTTKYYGVDITPSGDMGSTTVTIRGNQDCTTDDTSKPVRRCFEISPTIDRPAEVTFWYLESERNSNTASNVNVFHWDGNAWVQETGAYTRSDDGTHYSVKVTSVDSYSPFILDDAASPTAVTLRSFAARPAGGKNGVVLALLVLGVVGVVWARRRKPGRERSV